MKLWEFIEFENVDDLLVYKHPCQDFNTSSKLIVREGQKAIFLHNGEVADVFGAGRHSLSTENLPVLGKIMRIPTGGVNTFSAEVFFISIVSVMNLKWGTSAPMDLQDPRYNVICKVSGCGEAAFKVNNPEAFLKNIIGTTSQIEKSDLQKFFRSTINMYIKNAVSDAMAKDGVSILELNSHLLDLANISRQAINEKIAPFGVEITLFSFENLGAADDDPSLIKLKDALAKKTEMDIVGYNYQQERSYDVMEEFAKNGGVNNGVTSAIVGAGVGIGMAGAVANTVKDMSNPIANNAKTANEDTIVCRNCGAKISKSAKFCPECGEKNMKKRFCVQCGAEISENAKFCMECGAKQE